jgi:chromosome segregation ATPase
MDIPTDQLLLRRPISVKAVVTPRWKKEAQEQLQAQINQLDAQLQQLEVQVQQMVNELQKQKVQIIGAEGSLTSEETHAQIQNIQLQASSRKSELLEQKNQLLQQLNQVQTLEMEQQVEQGQIDSFFYIKQGDNLISKMQVEVLLRDGVIEDIKGEL